MSQPTDRRTQILDAALEVFSTKGFHKATNKDIASAAGGMSPGLIYHYFKDKEDLFISLVRERATLLQLTDHPDALMALPPREALSRVANAYLSMFKNATHVALFRIVITESIRFPQMGDMLYRVLISKLFNLIRSYFDLQVERGILRPHDSAIATRSFVGMIMVHVLAREVLHQPEALAVSDEQVISAAVDIFMQGLENPTDQSETKPFLQE